MAALLEMRGISRSFPGVRALEGVDFAVRRGEVHALMGGNGAGKSTLINVLTGVFPRDAGAILLDGQPVSPASPRAAEALGISTVYQEINLIPDLSVEENICLGRQPTRWGLLRWGAIRQRARAALARLELELDVSRQLSTCSVAVQQMVALARALDIEAKLLVLDEPTSSLDEREVEELFTVMRRLRSQGLGIVFVTHFLDQVYAVADRITVLRDGRLVGEYATAELPRVELVARMIGRSVPESGPATPAVTPTAATDKTPLVEAEGLGRKGALRPLDLAVGTGEVVGLAGLLGSGRSELARLLFGIDRADWGRLRVAGRPARLRSPRQAMRLGFALTPEDRKVAGIVPDLSVRENLVLALQAGRGPWRKLRRRHQQQVAEQFIAALGIKTPSPEAPVRTLSGGNQQKVLLARWLATEPRLLILDEPTRGIDVGAKEEIQKLVSSLREKGMGILFISGELEEVVRSSQRVVVLRDRRKVGELTGAEISEGRVMEAIASHQDQEAGSGT
jgi:simple sugar transport system ATP-binding protein